MRSTAADQRQRFGRTPRRGRRGDCRAPAGKTGPQHKKPAARRSGMEWDKGGASSALALEHPKLCGPVSTAMKAAGALAAAC